MFSPLYHIPALDKTGSSKVDNSSYYPLTPVDDCVSELNFIPESAPFSLEEDAEMANDDYEQHDFLQQEHSLVSDNDMVYFAIHRPARFTASDESVIRSIEPNTPCYAINSSGDFDNNTIDNVSSSSTSSSRSVLHFKGSELTKMIEEYPNAIFYALFDPTWAEQDQIDDFFQQYPDAVVYSVPRPRHLVPPTAEPIHPMNTDQSES
ncbi:hypothetical protein INT43_004732 [Umbelopsis isabellina]|uniref:Uncharacterized protein n=1 Tax=Mortierella isabellina TaxID=91625 RepID=A0A8H7PGA9_MORIS|nr:hypothetical protein INT43_004732 [Umbelopsis isabellina]